MPWRTFQLLSKGIVFSSGSQTESPSMKHRLSITINSSLAQKLAPTARIVVWYITERGEIVSDSLDFTVNGAFANEVNNYCSVYICSVVVLNITYVDSWHLVKYLESFKAGIYICSVIINKKKQAASALKTHFKSWILVSIMKIQHMTRIFALKSLFLFQRVKTLQVVRLNVSKFLNKQML